MIFIKCSDPGYKSNSYTRLVIINWEQTYLKEIVFGIRSQVGYILTGFPEDSKQKNISPQLNINLSQEVDVIDFHKTLSAINDAKNMTYIFIPG